MNLLRRKDWGGVLTSAMMAALSGAFAVIGVMLCIEWARDYETFAAIFLGPLVAGFSLGIALGVEGVWDSFTNPLWDRED